MSHPEIPPNSPYFRQRRSKWMFSVGPITRIPLDVNSRTAKYVVEARREWVPVIAAVAAEAWREEYLRILHSSADLDEGLILMNKASEAVDAWRTWGREETK